MSFFSNTRFGWSLEGESGRLLYVGDVSTHVLGPRLPEVRVVPGRRVAGVICGEWRTVPSR